VKGGFCVGLQRGYGGTELDQESSHSCCATPGLQQLVLTYVPFITEQLSRLSVLHNTAQHKNDQ